MSATAVNERLEVSQTATPFSRAGHPVYFKKSSRSIDRAIPLCTPIGLIERIHLASYTKSAC